MMTPHGPDVDAFEKASNAELKPVKLDATLVRVLVAGSVLVWPARPSQQAPRGEEGKGRSSIHSD